MRASGKWANKPIWHTSKKMTKAQKLGEVKYHTIHGESLSGLERLKGYQNTGKQNLKLGDSLKQRAMYAAEDGEHPSKYMPHLIGGPKRKLP